MNGIITTMIDIEKVRRYQATIIQKQCIECGRSFDQRRSLSGICSDACKVARRRRMRPQTFKQCEHCGETFGPVGKLSVRFCSSACGYAWKTGKTIPSKGKARPHTVRARVATCLKCGVEFRATKDTHKRQQLYCSHTCYLANRRVSQFERSVGDALERHGMALEPQKRIGRWTIDFAVTGTPLVIEADGSYWHAPAKVQERDRRKDADMARRGLEIHRVDELRFYADPEAEIAVIIRRWEEFTGLHAELVGG